MLLMTQKGNMRYEEFRRNLIQKGIFDLKNISMLFPDFDARRLSEWQKKGYISKIINGFYVFSDVEISESMLMKIANVIYSHSYISFETALSHYGLIPESVYQITSASTRKTKIFNTLYGSFSYRSISPQLFFGYMIDPHSGYIIASAEKALLDHLYFRKQFDENDLFEWRLNIDEYRKAVNEELIEKYLRIFNNKSLKRRYDILKEFINA
jgi:predicted transcriptional regulator of viral defense system